MTAPNTWTFAVILVGLTVGTLVAAGLAFALYERRAMRHEGKAARHAD